MEEYSCQNCGHSFPSDGPRLDVRCPRCDSAYLATNRWLLGSDEADLSAEEYRHRVRVSI